jgi:hypothetical protein
MEVDYKDRILEFPDSMSQDDIEMAIQELPEEKALPKKELSPADRYKTGIALKRINPTVAKEVRRIAMEKQHGYIANDPPSFKNFVRNIDIPEYVDELVNGLSGLIAGTGLFAYRFGRNIMQDGNEAIIQKGHPILPGMGSRVQKQLKPTSDLVQAIYYDWKAMFAGEVSNEISKLPLGKYRDALFEKVERQGLGDTLKYFIQDNPLDALLLGYVVKNMATAGTRLSLEQAQKIIPKSTKVAKTLDSILSTKRTPIIYGLGPEKSLGQLSARAQKDTLKMLKPTSDIGGKTLEEVVALAASDPVKAVQHIKQAKIPLDMVIEGFRNKGAKVIMSAPKDIKKTVATNLQLAIDRIEKISVKGKRAIFERKYSEDILTKYIFEKTFDAALEKFPVMRAALEDHKAKKLVNTMRNLSDEANFTERNAMHQEIFKELNKLSKEEQKIAVPYLEGRARLINEPSEQFKNFELWYRQLIAKNEDYLWKAGKLPADRDILYQPIAKATGQSIEQVKADLGTFTPVYVHHMFPKMFDAKMGIHFAETTGRRFQPGFMKHRYGVEGYSENLKEILPKYISEYIKLKNTEQFINNFTTKFGIKVNLKNLKEAKGVLYIGDEAYPGYKILAPDGYLSYYRGKIDCQKEIIKRMENTTFNEAVGEVIAKLQLPKKEYLGVSKNKVVYLVPKKILGELESFATPIFGSHKAQDVIRLVVDKPTQVWKDSVLAVSPRWIKNNVIGDIIFNTFEGVGPLSYCRAFKAIYIDCIPDKLLVASFANVMKYNPKLGKTAETAIGGYVQAFLDTKTVAGIAYAKDLGYSLNTLFEQPFVRALYIKVAREKAVALLKQQKIARTETNILAKMRVIKGDSVLVQPLIDKVHETLPVFNLLGNFERKYIRRFVPFANWYKFMLKYGAQLPSKHPFKLVGARGLGALTEEHREEVFKDYFPFMAREIADNGIPARFNHMWPIGQKGEPMAKFFNVRGMNPFTTISDFVELDFLNMASPILTVPVEQFSGRAVFGNRKFESGEAGITVTHKGVEYEEFAKVRPPLVDHILSQMPQYTLLKKWLVPARQWDTGTILNPDPILNPDTGEYVYPIESMEKILNMLGVDQKTLDIRKVWHQYQTRKAQALGRALTKHREHLSFEDIRNILNELQADKKLWEKLRNEMKEKALYEKEKTTEFLEKVK